MTSHTHSSTQTHHTRVPDPLHTGHPKELPPTPVIEEPAFNQKYIIIGAIFVAFILGLFFFNKRDKSKTYRSTSSVDTIQISPTPTPTVIHDQTLAKGDISKTVSWIHYENGKKDYSFQYPKDNYVDIDTQTAKLEFCHIGTADVSVRIYPPLYQKPLFETEFAGNLLFTVGSIDNPDNLSVDNWVQKNCANTWFTKKNANVTISYVNIDNLTGTMYTVRSAKRQDSGRLIVLSHNNKLYFLHGWPYEEQLFNLITSTFKFMIKL